MILYIYFCKTIVKFQLLVLSVLATVFLLLDLIERLSEVGEGTFNSFNAIQVTILNSPYLILDLLPSTFLIGSVIGLRSLITSSELIVARTLGFTKYKLLIPLCFLSLTFSVLSLISYQFVVPTFQGQSHKLSTKKISGTTLNSEQIWIKRKNEILSINDISSSSQPNLIEIFTLAKNGEIKSVVSAEKAYISEQNEWLLFNVEKIVLNGSFIQKTKKENMVWQGFISQSEYAKLLIPPKALSLTALLNYLTRTEFISADQNLFRSELWKKLSLPITLLAMSLVAVPIAGSAITTRQESSNTVFAGFYAMVFFIVHQTISNFDQILEWPSSLSWTLPPVIVIWISLFLIKNNRF